MTAPDRLAPRSPLLVGALLFALLHALSSCQPSSATEARGLVLLPSDEPLAPSVKERDQRLFFHDFGRVPDGNRVARVFRLRNQDPVDVSITRVVPGCGCTVASLRAILQDGTVIQGEPTGAKVEKLLTVPPGALAEIEIRIDTTQVSAKNVDKLLIIGVTTDSPGGYFLNLEVHILVERAWYAVPESLQLGQVPENGGGQGTVDLVLAPGFEGSIVGLESVPAGLQAELRTESRPAGAISVLDVRLEPPLALGPLRHTLRIATTDGEGLPAATIEVPVIASVVPDLISDPTRLVLAGARGAALEATVRVFSLLEGQRLRIEDLAFAEPEHERWLSASFQPIEPDANGRAERWSLQLSTAALPQDLESPTGGTLVLRFDDSQHPVLEVGYVVHAR